VVGLSSQSRFTPTQQSTYYTSFPSQPIKPRFAAPAVYPSIPILAGPPLPTSITSARFKYVPPPVTVVQPPPILPTWRHAQVPNNLVPWSFSDMNNISKPVHPKIRYRVLSSLADPLDTPPMTYPTRPFGFDASGAPLPVNVHQDLFDWNIMATLFSNVTAMVANSVCKNSQYTYKTGWKRWITFTSLIGTDRFLQIIPPNFQRYIDVTAQAFQASFAILACCGYLAYLITHPIKPTSAPSACGYLSAVRYNLKKFGLDIAFMDESTFLKAARAGVINEWREIPGNSLADRQTLPISVGMLEHAAQRTLDFTKLSDFATFVASIFAYTILCRCSEYLHRKSTNHHLRSQSVKFWVHHLNPADATPLSPFLYIPSCDIWQFPKTRIAGVTVSVIDSKADQHGSGDKYPFPRFIGPRPPGMVYEFSELLYDIASRARPLHDQPFFSSSTNERMSITADSLNKWLKTSVAPLFELNASRVHTHSLRFAGASTLAAAQIPDSVIMKMGRWKSLAFLGYIRLAKEIFARVAAALADRTTFSITDVRNLLPSA